MPIHDPEVVKFYLNILRYVNVQNVRLAGNREKETRRQSKSEAEKDTLSIHGRISAHVRVQNYTGIHRKTL